MLAKVTYLKKSMHALCDLDAWLKKKYILLILITFSLSLGANEDVSLLLFSENFFRQDN